MSPHRWAMVVPTLGRPSLASLLQSLDAAAGPRPDEIVLVDDRRASQRPLSLSAIDGIPVRVLRSGGVGPARARNLGWRSASTPWVVFVDDDVMLTPTWPADLAEDLAACGPDVGGSQGRVIVPLPADRAPTDWERTTAGLAGARWITADMAYRRSALERVDGFDERFPRAYREDADLGLRVTATGDEIVHGTRVVHHPVRPAPWHVSIRSQRGNADDALMDVLHGPRWRDRAGAPSGRRRRHLAVTAAGATAAAAAVLGGRRTALLGGALWVVGTAELAWHRIAPGPRTAPEVAAMVVTSVAIPPAATWWWSWGRLHARRLRDQHRVEGVLFDRDGTLVVDVPYNGDPSRVVLVPGARAAVDRLRSAGIPLGMVTNQSGVARGVLSLEQVHAVNRQVERLLGPFDVIEVCPHGPDDGCECRKPAPGMILKAAAALGVHPRRCAVIGDIGSDVAAALAAGARPILVPTPITRSAEVCDAPEVVADLGRAVARVLSATERGSS